MRGWVLVAAFVCGFTLSFAVAGCGSDSGNPAATTPLPAAKWRREVNAVCQDVGSKLSSFRLPATYRDIPPFVAGTVPLWRQQEQRIRALVPPRSVAELIDSYLDSLSNFEAALVEIDVATERNDGGRRAGAQEKAREWAFYMKRAATLIGGLRRCADQRAP